MRQRGGLSEIIAVVILVGIVLALLISSVVPMGIGTRNIIDTSTNKVGDLQNRIK